MSGPRLSATGFSPPVVNALQLVQEILDHIYDNVSDAGYCQGRDFFESVLQNVVDVRGTILRKRTVTPNQMSALYNWRTGVRRWRR